MYKGGRYKGERYSIRGKVGGCKGEGKGGKGRGKVKGGS